MTRNNNPFSPLADEEPDDPTNHAPMDCSSNNVTNTISDQMPACTEPTTQRNVLASQLAPMRLPHPTVRPQILRSGRAIPVSPLIALTQTCNESQPTPTPNCLRPYQQQSPLEPYSVYLPPLPPFTHLPNQSHHSTPSQAPPTLNPPMTTVPTLLHDPALWPFKSIHHVDL
jgi:hypothetical protein